MKAAILGILIAAAIPASAAKNTPGGMALGQVIDPAPGDVIDGWENWSGSDFARRARAKDVVTETRECCTSLFFRGSSYLIVRTVRLSNDDDDGFGLRGRIVETLKIDTDSNDELVECDLLWIQPAANFRDKRTNLTRSYVVTDEGIQLVRWIDDHDRCYMEERD